MRLTITSEDSLERVLSAVGGMFGVTLTAAAAGQDAAAARPEPAERAPRTGARRRASTGRRRRSVRTEPSTADIRRWAQDNGYDLSARGRIPAKITAAYRAAH